MRTVPVSVAKLLITLLAVVALIFGARELTAGNPATACMYNPPHSLGECISETWCQSQCESWGGTQGICNPNNCCGCLFR
jgi:hypothetical protein